MQHSYSPQEIRLATEISDTLGDRDSMAQHLLFVRRYNEDFLRETLAKVMAIPESQIRKSRAALYTFLINQRSRYGDARH